MFTDSVGIPERKMFITVDLEKFPGLLAEIDESVRFEGSGRICSIRHSDYCHELEIEVTQFKIPTHTSDSVGAMNEADLAMGKLKKGSRY